MHILIAVDTQAIEARFGVVAGALLAGVHAAAVHAVRSLDDAHDQFVRAHATAAPPPSARWDRLLNQFTSKAAATESSLTGLLGQVGEHIDRFARGLLIATAAFLAAEVNDLEDHIALLPADRRWEETRAHLDAIAYKVGDAAHALINHVEDGTWRELLEFDPPVGHQVGVDLVTASSQHVPAGTKRDHTVTRWDSTAHGTLMPGSTRWQGECPYPGLAAFNADQARWFFGRGQLTQDLIRNLNDRRFMGGMQMVMAPSGAGKSSLLHAGLLPKLADGALPGSSRWPQLMFTPTADPLTALATQIAALTGGNPATLAEQLATDPQPVEAVLRRYTGGEDSGARLVVVVDQFEELFTLCTDDQQRRAFIELLAQLASLPPDSAADMRPLALVVVGVRADFYADCANDPDLCTALKDSPLVVRPMSATELREAILYPARDVGLDIEAGLVELLLRDLGDTAPTTTERGMTSCQAGRLPLLAHALRATWQQRHGHTLTVEGYRSTGGIYRAVATSADRVFTGLDPAGRHSARTLFLRLIKIGDGTEDTRRRLARADLLRDLDPSSVGPVVDAFTQGRLLTQERDTVEITHEALLRAWPRLRQWIDTDRAGNLIRQELDEAATAWNRDHRDTAGLYRGSRLETARTWATSRSIEDDLSPAASAFLTASTTQERHTVKLRRAVLVLLSVLSLVASGAAVVALRQTATARSERDTAIDTAISNQITAQADQLRSTDVSLAAQLDLTAYRMRPTPALYTALVTLGNAALFTPLVGHTGSVTAVAFSPDGHTLATSSFDRTVRLWDMNVDQAIQRICVTTTNTLTPQKWEQYVPPDLPYRPPCP